MNGLVCPTSYVTYRVGRLNKSDSTNTVCHASLSNLTHFVIPTDIVRVSTFFKYFFI